MHEEKKLVIVDKNTGAIEAEDIHEYKTKAQYEKEKQNKKRRNDGKKYFDNNIRPLPGFLQEQYGNFIHTQYERLLSELNNDTATAFRFIYLCTYMDYDTGYITYGSKHITDKDLRDIFDVSSRLMTNIKNILYDKKLIYSDLDGYIKVNTDFCYRGDIKDKTGYSKHCTRIFNNAIQELYKKSEDPREHKLLGKFILILPYVNIYHNIICLNPKERDIEKLIPPDTRQLCEILNINYHNNARVKKELFDITIGGKIAILLFTNPNYVKAYAVNPALYYGGTKYSDVKQLCEIFKVKGGIDK